MELLRYIPRGRENAVTRQQLANLTGKPDRAIRKEIERLRHAGVAIVSLSDAKGYWLTDDLGEIEQFLRETNARERTSRRTTYLLRKMVAQARGYQLVPVRAHLRRIKTTEIDGQERIGGGTL